MDTPQLKSHLTTSNIYVRLQIIRDNLARLRNHQHSNGYNLLPSSYRFQIKKLIDSQNAIKNHIQKEINFVEQTSFPFGGFLSSN